MSQLSISRLKIYGLAILATLIALILSLTLRIVTQQAPFVLFFAAVVLSAGYGGVGPGLVATFLSVILADYFLLPPYNSFNTNPQSILVLIVFTGVSIVINALYERHNLAIKAIFEQREALRVTLSSIGDAVITTDPDGKLTFLNPAAEALTGWGLPEAKDLEVGTVFRIIDVQTRQPIPSLTAKVLKNGLTFGLANHTILIARNGTEYNIDDSAAPVRNREGKIIGIVITFRDVSAQHKAEAAQQLLIKVNDQLVRLGNDQIAFSEMAKLFVNGFADWCEIAVLNYEQWRRQALIHADLTKQPLLEQFYEYLPEPWDTAAEITRSGVPILNNQISDSWPTMQEVDAESLQRLTELRLNSQIYIPLRFNDQVLGAIGFSRSADRPHFVQSDLVFAQEVAHRIAIAMENARLTEQTDKARRSAERNAARIARLQSITEALSASLLPRQVAQTIVDQLIVTIDDVYGSQVALVNDDDRTLKLIYAAGYALDSQTRWESIPLDANLPASEVVRNGEPAFIKTPTEWGVLYPQFEPWVSNQSLAMLPLRIESKTIGFMAVSFDQPQAFPEEDRALLINLADQCGQALHRAQLYAAEKQAREQIDTILENVSDAFFSFDNELHYVYLNRQAERITGSPREKVLGRTPEEIFPKSVGEPFYDYAHRALTENRVIEYEQLVPGINLWAALRLYPYKGGLTIYLQDITARKQAEAEAQLNTTRLKGFVDAGVIGIIFATDDGNILDANGRFLEMIGYSREELQAGLIRWADITPPEYALQDQLAIKVAEQTDQSIPIEKEYIHKDGHRIPVLIGGIRSEGIWVSFVLDLTERKRAEQRLRVLTEVSAVLATSLDYRTTLLQITKSIVPRVADWCTVHLLDANGSLQQVALYHKDPAKIAWGLQIQREYPDDPNAPTGLYQVVRSGQSEFYPHIPDEMLVAAANGDEKLLHLLREIGYSAVIIVPLKVQGQTIGAIQFVNTESRQRYTSDDLTLAQDIALRAASAIENARLYSEVHQQRERLQVTLTSIGDAVIATDAQGRITFINTIAESLTGWTQAEAVGKDLNEVFQILDEETKKAIESPVLKVLRDGTITSLVGHTLLVARDGTYVPVDDSAAPIRDTNNDLIGVILVFRDIRERRDTEMQLQRTLQRTYDLYNTSRQIGIATTPKDLLDAMLTSRYLQNVRQATIAVFNTPWHDDHPSDFTVAATLNDKISLGFAEDGLYHNSPLMTIFSSSHPVFIEDVGTNPSLDPKIRNLLQEHEVSSLIMYPLWVGNMCFGMLALYCTSPYRLTDEDFQHVRIFADQVAIVMENVRLFESEKRARKEAEHANELKLKFLAMISHELRTPLTSIKGFTTSLLATDVTWEPEQQYEFINIINDESDKLTDLISQLLDLSQLQAGMMRIQASPQSLSKIVDSAMIQLTALTQHHQLRIDLPPDLPRVLADPRRIAEVFTNLVGNATKYSPEDTTVAIRAAVTSGNMVEITVSDQGPGIPPDSRVLIFEAFRQLERKSSQKIKGAGLGLAICKGLVEAHHGQIWVADQPDSGTTICFTLPIAPSG